LQEKIHYQFRFTEWCEEELHRKWMLFQHWSFWFQQLRFCCRCG